MRLQNYDLGTALPRFVQAALDDAYTMTNLGLLCWTPIPPVGLVPTARVCFITVEAVFAHPFCAIFETKMDGL